MSSLAMNTELFPEIASPRAVVLGDIFAHERANVVLGDCRELLRTLPSNSIDSCVTDSPYELGFMGKAWDKSGIAFDASFWREIHRVLRPGAYVLSFGGSRTFHRIGCAIEDGGFEIVDSLAWMYGSGFPKSLDLGEGRGTALKPAFEPVIMGFKPLQGTYEENLAKWGTGALNIDACRVECGAREAITSRKPAESGIWGTMNAGNARSGVTTLGRWPANVMLDEEAAALLNQQSGNTGANSPTTGLEPSAASTGQVTNLRKRVASATKDSKAGASRFFYCPKTSPQERNLGCEHLETKSGGDATDREDDSAGLSSPRSGAGRGGGSKNHHPTVKPVAVMRWLVRLVTPPGGVVIDPFTGSGSTGIAALLEGRTFIGSEITAEYAPIIEGRMRAAVEGRFA